MTARWWLRLPYSLAHPHWSSSLNVIVINVFRIFRFQMYIAQTCVVSVKAKWP